MDWWVANLLREDPAQLIAWVVWVIGSIVLHELAHGWAALWQGDQTPRETGHMTWNPLVHMGGMSLIIFALVGIAWGLMPVNPNRFRSRYGDAYVSLAGPAMNIALAAVCVVVSSFWVAYGQGASDSIYHFVWTFFYTGAFLNLVLAAFNLLPVPPLDGSRILASYSPPYRNLLAHEYAPIISLVLLVVLFSRAGGYIFGPAHDAAFGMIRGLSSLLPGGAMSP